MPVSMSRIVPLQRASMPRSSKFGVWPMTSRRTPKSSVIRRASWHAWRSSSSA